MEVKIIKNSNGYIANIMTRTNNFNVNFKCNIIRKKLFVDIVSPHQNLRFINNLLQPISELYGNKYSLSNNNIVFKYNNTSIPIHNNHLLINDIVVTSNLAVDSPINNDDNNNNDDDKPSTRQQYTKSNSKSKSKRKLDEDDDDDENYIEKSSAKRVKNKIDDRIYLGASNTKYFQNDDTLGYNLKLLKINNINNLIDFACSPSELINESPEQTFDSITNFSLNSSHNFSSNTNEISGYIFEKGIQYEKFIVSKLKNLCDKLHLSFISIVEGKPIYENYDQYLLLTNNSMKNNIDVIYQGMIQSPTESKYKFRGFPDLLVSCKAFKLLFFNHIDRYNNLNTSFDIEINSNTNNYIVIDIKSSTITLNADGRTARNTGLLKYYKSQLATYGYIMNDLFPKKQTLTYILPYGLRLDYTLDKKKYEPIITNPHAGKFCLVQIDIENKDNEYYLNLNYIYDAYIDCLTKYETNIKNNYNFLFDEQIKELNKMYSNDDYINLEKVKKCNKLLSIKSDSLNKAMISKLDIPFVRSTFGVNDRSSIKYWIAKQTRSLSLLRGFNHMELLRLKEEGIYSYLQTEQIIKYLDSRSDKRTDINLIKAIVNANSDANYKPYYCTNIIDKITEFNNKFFNKKMICCLDFETIPLKLIINKDLIYDVNTVDEYRDISEGQKVFMIGCNFYENINGRFVFVKKEQLCLDKIYEYGRVINIDDDIYSLFIGLEKTINSIKSVNKLKNNEMAFVIWSQFEISVMKHFNKLNLYGRGKFYSDKDYNAHLFGITIIDLMKVLADNNNPVGIKGAFDCSLKSIANGLHSNGLLTESQIWNSDNIVNGFDAMYYALWYYSDKTNEKYKKIFEKIKNYNNTDCTIMADIINTTYNVLKN